jgi:cytochrome b subunit of formate dehydrogenase/mono/diheme cytochrome c family protein
MKDYVRFTLAQRVEHLIQLVSFTVLAVTGLPQKFAAQPWADAMIAGMGGIEWVRIIHRFSATVLLLATVYHFVVIAYKLYVQRVKMTMLPDIRDARDAWQTLLYNLGFSKRWPQMGRYTFEEKVEYWAFVWGTVVMAVTGFILWNPIATARFLPGQFIPAAKAAHGGEALLAVLAIIIWHMYGVHLRKFNRSMWTGKLSEGEMKHEHPLELAELEAGTAQRPVDPVRLQHRQRRFYPVAGVTAVVLLAAVIWFITFEQTAIATLPARPTVEVFAPQTPTPLPPTATPPPGGALAWNGYIGTLFAAKCTGCHGSAGGLALTTYAETVAGGSSGPAFISGVPEASPLVTVQVMGNHPGQLSADELARVQQWIAAGAPEQ